MTTSKRFWLSLIIFFSFMGLSVHAINKGVDLLSLSALLASISLQAGAYMHFETKRPSGTDPK